MVRVFRTVAPIPVLQFSFSVRLSAKNSAKACVRFGAGGEAWYGRRMCLPGKGRGLLMNDTGKNRGVDRRRLLAMSGVVVASLMSDVAGTGAMAAEAPVATTKYGKIRGFNVGAVKGFKGVPYGASTAGENRFMPPKAPAAWAQIRDTIQLGDRSPQISSSGSMEEEAVSSDKGPMSEDCLRLNLWTAGLRDGKKRPVMVWFHGGGFAGGSGGNPHYDGANLAGKHGVVVLTVNHRLNAFGFLYLGGIGGEKYTKSGNVGMLDCVAALDWVKDNIEEFGGDPNNVTIFGQSGGGGKVTTLLAMPQAVGRIHRAIAESGLALKALTTDEATESAKKLMAQLGVAPDQVDQLQQMPYQKILDALSALKNAGRFAPVLDQHCLVSGNGPFDPVAPSQSADVPMILGNNLTEVTFFSATPLDPIDDSTLHADVKKSLRIDDGATDKIIATYKRDYPGVSNVRLYQIIGSDNWLTANVALVAERKAALGKAPAYVYHFEKPTPVRGGKLGVPHTLEICYVFDNLDVPTATLITGDGKERQALADKMSRAWTNFAKTGKPDAEGLPHWPAYSPAGRAVMIFNDECSLVMDPHPDERTAITQIHFQAGQVSRA
jgi:para-nitrobenzyl esterase